MAQMFEVWTISIIIIHMLSVRRPVGRRKDLSVAISIEVIHFLAFSRLILSRPRLQLVPVVFLADSFRIELTG